MRNCSRLLSILESLGRRRYWQFADLHGGIELSILSMTGKHCESSAKIYVGFLVQARIDGNTQFIYNAWRWHHQHYINIFLSIGDNLL